MKERKRTLSPSQRVFKDQIIEEVDKRIDKALEKIEYRINESFQEAAQGINQDKKNYMEQFQAARRSMQEHQDRLRRTKERIDKSLVAYHNRLKKIENFVGAAEETLRNCLLAIKQREYLHAWYPEQNGYPEMNVVGSHPNQVKNRDIRKRS